MTPNELLEKYLTAVKDEEEDHFSADEAWDLMDQVHRELLEAGGGTFETVTLDYDDDKSPDYAFYRFPERFLELAGSGLKLNGDTKRVLRAKTLDEMVGNAEYGYDWESRTGDPYCWVKGMGDYRTVRVYPYPTTIAATLQAYCKVSARSLIYLSAPLLPVDFHMAIPVEAAARALDRLGEAGDPKRADSLHKEAAPLLTRFRARAARKNDATPPVIKGWRF